MIHISIPPASAQARSAAKHRISPAISSTWEKRSVIMSNITIDPDVKPGEYVIKSLFTEFAIQAEKKIEVVMAEPLVSSVCSLLSVYVFLKLFNLHLEEKKR